MQRIFNRTTLSNGLVVLSEEVPHVRSVSLGIWVRRGSRHEPEQLNGISHFIEHTLFKGTTRRTAQQIALEADVLGGNLDAFTGTELASYQLKVLDNHFATAFDILADLVTAPLFEEVELDKERNVILEEIKMTEDSPEDYLFELFHSSFWPDHPIGRPITGTTETVNSFNRSCTLDYYQQVYSAGNLVVAAAGNIKHHQVLELSEKYLSHLPSGIKSSEELAPQPHLTHLVKKKAGLEQTHIILAAPSPSALAPERYACSVFSTILGGGLSSRLFQSVRERHGLAYTVYSSTNPYKDAGYMSVYMAVASDKVRQAVELSVQQICSLKSHLVSDEELQAAKEQLRSAILLSNESVTAKMHSLAENEIIYGRDLTNEEVLSAIDSVTSQDVLNIANQTFINGNISLAVLGPRQRLQLDLNRVNC